MMAKSTLNSNAFKMLMLIKANGVFFFLVSFENESETTDFVKCKIESLVANTVSERPKEGKYTGFCIL